MPNPINIRPITHADYQQWLPLWEGYNAFYNRTNVTALPLEITETTWLRFLDPDVPMFALVAESEGRLVGLTHYLYHYSTSAIGQNCYLQDLFTDAAVRGKGVARALINEVYKQAKLAGSPRVYWQTHETNHAAMALYDKVADNSGFVVYRKML